MNEEGEVEIEVKWSGFVENTIETLDNVVVGAHLLLKKYLETNEKKLDDTLI